MKELLELINLMGILLMITSIIIIIPVIFGYIITEGIIFFFVSGFLLFMITTLIKVKIK